MMGWKRVSSVNGQSAMGLDDHGKGLTGQKIVVSSPSVLRFVSISS